MSADDRAPTGVNVHDPYGDGTFSGVRGLVKRLANRLGYDIVRHPSRHSLQWHLQLLFARLEINCVLDVGANLGQYARFLREHGYQGHIVSFEPVPEAFEQLRHAMSGDPKWRGFQYALGERDGEAGFQVSGGDAQASSLLELNDEGPKRWGSDHELARRETVEVRRLDTVLDTVTEGIPRPRIYLKMDTQGYDLRVLEGAGARLPDVLALQSELAVHEFYQGMTPFAEALARFRAYGYAITGIFPLSREHDHLRVIEFDCVMMR